MLRLGDAAQGATWRRGRPVVNRPNRDEPERVHATSWLSNRLVTWFMIIWFCAFVVVFFLSSVYFLSPNDPMHGGDTAFSVLILVLLFVPLILGIGLLVRPSRFAREMDQAIVYWPRLFGMVYLLGSLCCAFYEASRIFNPSLVHSIGYGTFDIALFGYVGIGWMLGLIARLQMRRSQMHP